MCWFIMVCPGHNGKHNNVNRRKVNQSKSSKFILLSNKYMVQINSKNKIELLEDPQEEAIHRLTQRLGLVAVGWIFTDLVADDLTKGTVKNFRGNVVGGFC